MTFVLKFILKMVATEQAKKLIIQIAEDLAKRSDNTIDDKVVAVFANVLSANIPS